MYVAPSDPPTADADDDDNDDTRAEEEQQQQFRCLVLECEFHLHKIIKS